jgi:hypothetical protein
MRRTRSEGWIAEFEAAGEDEVRIRLYRGSGMHPEAKFHAAVRWLREQARARKLREEQTRRGYENAHVLRVAMASDVPTRSFSPEVSPSALSTRSSSTCSELNVPAAARFLDMGGTSPLRVPRIGPAFRFA